MVWPEGPTRAEPGVESAGSKAVQSAAALVGVPDLPDGQIVEAYEKAARQNVLAAVNPKVFFGYFSVAPTARGLAMAIPIPAWTATR